MAEQPTTERRHYTRVGFDAEVTLNQGDYSFSSHLIDISLNGVLLSTPEDYEISTGEPVYIHVKLADETQIHMKVELAHSSSTVLGFKCDSIDMESLSHLRRLIELNIDDPDAPERVLSELIHPIEQ